MSSRIGEKVRHIRELKNISQEYMSSKLGISIRAYSKIETEETQLSVKRLQEISNILQVGVPEVLGFEPQLVFNNSPNQQGGSYVAYNNTEIDQVKQLYERIIEDKTKIITLLEQELDKLKNPAL